MRRPRLLVRSSNFKTKFFSASPLSRLLHLPCLISVTCVFGVTLFGAWLVPHTCFFMFNVRRDDDFSFSASRSCLMEKNLRARFSRFRAESTAVHFVIGFYGRDRLSKSENVCLRCAWKFVWIYFLSSSFVQLNATQRRTRSRWMRRVPRPGSLFGLGSLRASRVH